MKSNSRAMQRVHSFFLKYLLLGIVVSLFDNGIRASERSGAICFDQLFHESWYKQILTSCMRLIYQLQNRHELSYDGVGMTEILVSKLTMLKYQIESLLSSSPYLKAEDVEYFTDLINALKKDLLAYSKESGWNYKERFKPLFVFIKKVVQEYSDRTFSNV